MIIAHDSSSKWKWAVRWKIKKTSLKINKTVHWSWKFQVKISIYINLGRFSLFIGRFYLWLVNKSEAKTKKVFNYKISIRFQRTKDSNLSSKGMKRILKKKQKLMIFIFKTFSAIQNQIKNSKDWRQHGKEPARQGIYELTTQSATELFNCPGGLGGLVHERSKAWSNLWIPHFRELVSKNVTSYALQHHVTITPSLKLIIFCHEWNNNI